MTFIDSDERVIALMQEHGRYPLRFLVPGHEEIWIEPDQCLHVSEDAAIAQAISEAQLIAASVYGENLEAVAGEMLEGLVTRAGQRPGDPLDIIAVENMLGAAAHLRACVMDLAPPHLKDWLASHVGFVEASVGRTVPDPSPEAVAAHPLMLEVEAVDELYFDASGFAGPIPGLKRTVFTEQFLAYEARKLYVHNMAHAVTAYLGALRNIPAIDAAMQEPVIRQTVEAAMRQACLAIEKRHRLPFAELEAFAHRLAERFDNPLMHDTIERVARDPMRKLQPEDRLLGAMHLCIEQGVDCSAIALGAAAAFRYPCESNPRWQLVRRALENDGMGPALKACSGVEESSPLGKAIVQAWSRLQTDIAG